MFDGKVNDAPSVASTVCRQLWRETSTVAHEIGQYCAEHKALTAGVVVASSLLGARLLSKLAEVPATIIEAPIGVEAAESLRPLSFGLVRAAPIPPTFASRIEYATSNLLQKVFYRASASEALDVKTIDLARDMPLVRHKGTRDLTSEWLETMQKYGIERSSVVIDRDLASIYKPIVSSRYSGAATLDIVEIGPGTSTIMPRTFASSSNLRSYTAIDNSLPYLENQAKLIKGVGRFETTLIRADAYQIPVETASKDVVVANAVPPFVTDPPLDMKLAYEEAGRVLKKGGELIVYPFKYSPEVHPTLDGLFEPVYARTMQRGSEQSTAMVFKKL